MNININPISNANYRHDLRTRKNNATNVLNENRQINDMPNYYYPAFKANLVAIDEEVSVFLQKLSQEIRKEGFYKKNQRELQDLINKIDKLIESVGNTSELNRYKSLLETIPSYKDSKFSLLWDLYKEYLLSYDESAFAQDGRILIANTLTERFPREFKFCKSDLNNNKLPRTRKH